MIDRLQFIPFRSPADKGWDEAWALYEASFPVKERRSLADHLRALTDPDFEADGIWQGDEFVGLFYYWRCCGWCYGEHLAVSPRLRGKNLGSRALEAFCRKVGRVVLEIDPPEDEISIRRLHFYQRLGFVENPYDYIHPSFSEPFEPHRLVLLSYPELVPEADAHELAEYVRSRVMRYSEHLLEPTTPKLR